MARVSHTTTHTSRDDSAPELFADHQDARAERTFSISISISAIRCTFTYVLIPLVFPFLGETTGVGPTIGAVVGGAAIIANFYSIQRFQRAGHRWRWHMTIINSAVIALLIFLVATDIAALVD